MTILFCTGTQFSGWEQLVATEKPNDRGATGARLAELNGQLSNKITSGQSSRPEMPPALIKGQAVEFLANLPAGLELVFTDSLEGKSLDFWCGASAEIHFLLFYNSPQNELSTYLANNAYTADTVAEIIRNWSRAVLAMLSFFMRNRSRCLLVNTNSVHSELTGLGRLMQEKFSTVYGLCQSSANKIQAPSALLDYLAGTLVLEDESALEIYDEVRSAGSVVCEADQLMQAVGQANSSLVKPFLAAVKAAGEMQVLASEQAGVIELKQQQLLQIEAEMVFYYQQFQQSQQVVEMLSGHLSEDKLLKLIRGLRRNHE